MGKFLANVTPVPVVKTDGVNKDIALHRDFSSPPPERSLLWHDRPDIACCFSREAPSC
ncbi:hypothetical protein GEV33_013222 [Tenebrio molitor]|uniref:Uncharacterized protein n=1 Tax=Tenebrio molitor TaxID=7067 RepID=A0A8J6H7L3_TENMO|nr:hypothetical protein GEV33_013222 [Tenebrio molitor]